ncbi:RNA polymerase sigma factor [Chitinophaga eiseniae]|uniref:RNA polymerase sigma factor n=1 Tax=Chitinophaga eiseniae TaxID=634771 RepID=A0A847SQ49_9BACT|nr:RNA polymerase sigma factor [Chitinophaga eiseniae]NLR81097.1 RNA polymerase sigma factor [Chitinophaga eiseniae]
MDDHSIYIAGLRNGSYKDFKALYDLFSGNLHGFVLRLTRSEEMAKDITQETFIKVWLYREKVDPDQSFKAFLFKIARNGVIDAMRKQWRSPVFEDYLQHCDELYTNGEEVTQRLDFDYFLRQLKAAKDKLTPRQREIFELRKEQGLSPAEISQKLGINEQTTYNILSTAVHILKKEIGPGGLLLFLLFFE